MDLTVPYTFYPIALPHRIAWVLFLLALCGGVAAGVARGLRSGWPRGLLAGALSATGLLVMSMIAGMVITFFLHDQ
jgi:hypothetical protein